LATLLTLRGPEFLALFIAICVVIYFLVSGAIAVGERTPGDAPRIRDPYVIAYLRGGLEGLIRVVTLSLVLRGLLQLDAERLRTADPTEIDRANVPIEKVILAACRRRAALEQIQSTTGVRTVGEEYRRHLLDRDLIANEAMELRRRLVVLIGVAVVVSLAIAKIFVALNTGHTNILFLVIVTILATIILVHKLGNRGNRTRRGDAVLRDLSALFDTLKVRRGGLSATAVPELTLVAAVFGIYVLPGQDSRLWRKIFPEPATSDSSASSSSSCGSSGCGGGGCGGGGCGGCGS
jgi:uncharacterized protein (TIGR04222 family)